MPGVPTDPWSAGLMAAGSVASAALNDKTSMNAQQSTGAVTFDNSGWAVNVGAGASQTASAAKSTSALGLPQLLQSPAVLILLAFVAFELAKHK